MKHVTSIVLGAVFATVSGFAVADSQLDDQKFLLELTDQQMEAVNAGAGLGAALSSAFAVGGGTNIALSATNSGADPHTAYANSGSLSFAGP